VKRCPDFLSQIVTPCGYVDSTKFAKPGEWPTVDGQHPTRAGYRKWGADIAEAVVEMKDQLH
jgi:lysophospholipase L1-like esterase